MPRTRERGSLESPGMIRGQATRDLEQGSHLRNGDRAGRQRIERGGERAAEVAGLRDQPASRRLVHDERRRQLGDEGTRRELAIFERRVIRHALDLGGQPAGDLDAPKLLSLRRAHSALEFDDAVEFGTQSSSRVEVGRGVHEMSQAPATDIGMPLKQPVKRSFSVEVFAAFSGVEDES